MENKLFTIVNKEDEASFKQDLKANPDNFKKKLIFVFGNSENYIMVNGEKFLHTPIAESTAVDLGLPSGLKWAAGNVGAKNPEDYGLYFAWGETVGYTAAQVKAGERAFSEEEYNAGSAASISTNLTLAQDAAHVNLGGDWRMPTKAEYQELENSSYTTQTWTDDYNGTGVKGRVFTSKVNGNSVFFPASGGCANSSVYYVGSHGSYWSASWYSSSDAYNLDFEPWIVDVYSSSRCFGFSVRGVCK